MDRRRPTEHSRRRIAAYDIRPVAHTRRVPRAVPAEPKPDISAYRIQGAVPLVTPQENLLKPLPVKRHTPRVEKTTHIIQENVKKPVSIGRMRSAHRKSRRRPQLALTALAVVVFLIGVGVSIDGFRKNQEVEAQITRGVVNAEGSADDQLDDTEPTPQAVKSHAVPLDAPRYIIIDAIGVKARIKALDTKASGELEVPKNIFDVGWYQSGNKPGQDGAMLMDGHVSSPRKAGVFKKLPNLRTGDVIKIERGDGRVFQYRVVKTKAFAADKVDMQSTVVPITPGKSGINLITCHGKVKPGTTDFSERFVVYAEEI